MDIAILFIFIILILVGTPLVIGYLAYKYQNLKFYGPQDWKVTDYKYIGSFKSGAEYELCCKIFNENGIVYRDGKCGGPGIAFWVLNEHYERATLLAAKINRISNADFLKNKL